MTQFLQIWKKDIVLPATDHRSLSFDHYMLFTKLRGVHGNQNPEWIYISSPLPDPLYFVLGGDGTSISYVCGNDDLFVLCGCTNATGRACIHIQFVVQSSHRNFRSICFPFQVIGNKLLYRICGLTLKSYKCNQPLLFMFFY